ncbi:MAG: hypothetical protein FJ267_08955, partial [Planctomycetes bacterium]|nr:hypothetical protein [Planctomycetota bacterium]
MRLVLTILLTVGLALTGSFSRADSIDLSQAVIVTRSGDLPSAEKVASQVLIEELAKRTGLTLKVENQWPVQASTVIALSVVTAAPAWKEKISSDIANVESLKRPEGFSIRIVSGSAEKPKVVFVTGADPRGLLFGVGKL